jgi:hypothetical protein
MQSQGRPGASNVRRSLAMLASAAIIATSLTAASAVASAPSSTAADPPPAAGVDHAKAAGILIDPGAADAMVAAPVGSCYNDPTQAKCPPANRVASPAESLTQGPYAAAAQVAAKRDRISAHAAIDQCAINVNAPYFAAGLAQTDGKNQCYSPVTSQELYVYLYDYISTGKRLLDTRSATGPGGTTIRASPKFDCSHPVSSRKYESHAEGYALLQGVWYAASQTKTNTMTCPY